MQGEKPVLVKLGFPWCAMDIGYVYSTVYTCIVRTPGGGDLSMLCTCMVWMIRSRTSCVDPNDAAIIFFLFQRMSIASKKINVCDQLGSFPINLAMSTLLDVGVAKDTNDSLFTLVFSEERFSYRIPHIRTSPLALMQFSRNDRHSQT